MRGKMAQGHINCLVNKSKRLVGEKLYLEQTEVEIILLFRKLYDRWYGWAEKK